MAQKPPARWLCRIANAAYCTNDTEGFLGKTRDFPLGEHSEDVFFPQFQHRSGVSCSAIKGAIGAKNGGFCEG